ncbi:TPA: hypothetical protein I7730_14335 [Vibrio vulnificus]|uniref:Secreted protein n=1 Tax=Vibrio vulnificus TaxID=672 RepID=A0A8H9N188_VIBVL|nr:hypothetical protein [Vibrio vulnificus]HAS8540965.1 hypothetical protein [Vibrio vulnificus]
MNNFKNIRALFAILMFSCVSNSVSATVLKEYVNGYEETHKDFKVFDRTFSEVRISKFKVVNENKYEHFVAAKLDDLNGFSIKYRTQVGSQIELETVLTDLSKLNTSRFELLEFESEERLTKSEILAQTHPASPVYKYLSKCVKKDFESSYKYVGGKMIIDLNIDDDSRYFFELDVDNQSVSKVNEVYSSCSMPFKDVIPPFRYSQSSDLEKRLFDAYSH